MPPQWQNMSPPENRGIDALMGLMNALDLPASVVRDLVGGEGLDSFDQIWTPLSSENRMSGRDVLREWNWAGDEDTWGNFGGGLLAEMALDPINLASMGGYGAAKYIGRGLKAANKESKLLRKLGAMPEEVFNRPRSYRMGREGAYLNDPPGYRGEGKWNTAGMGEHESGIMGDLSGALDDHDEFGDLFSDIQRVKEHAASNSIPRSVTEIKLLELMDDASDLGIDPGKMQINKDLILASNKGLRRPNLHRMIQDLEDEALNIKVLSGHEGASLGFEDAIRAFPEEKMQRVLVDAQNPFSTSGEMPIEEVNEIFRDLPGGRQVERVGESFAHDDPSIQLEAFIDRASGAEDIGMIDEGQFDLLSGATKGLYRGTPDLGPIIRIDQLDDALSEIGPDMVGMGLDVSDLYTPQVDSGISGQVDAMRRLMAQNDVMRTGKITGDDVLRSLQRALGPRRDVSFEGGGKLDEMPIEDLLGSLRSLDKGGGQHDVLRWLGDKGYDALFSRRGADEFVSPLSRGGRDPFEIMQGMMTKGDDYITTSGAPESGTDLTGLLEEIYEFVDRGGNLGEGPANPDSMARLFASDLEGMTDMDLSDMLAQMNPGKGPKVYGYPHIAPELGGEIPKLLPEVLLAALLARNAGKHGLVSAGRQGFVGDQGGG